MSIAVYEAVTARIVESLERGVVPWRKPWHESASLPVNAISNRPYQGVNVFLLGLGLFRDPRWLTFRQAQQLGGYVKSGERSMLAIFWKRLEIDREVPDTAKVRPGGIPFLRYYHVFNVEQCEGLRLPSLARPDAESPVLRIERAEALIHGMTDPPTIRECGSSAWYRPSDDLIQVPPVDAFETTDAFYATLFHELGHATGHEKRLNRPGVTGTIQFGSNDYGREELVAELTSAFCCAALGLDNSLVEDSASYLSGWLKLLKNDSKAIVAAASQAQRASNFISGETEA